MNEVLALYPTLHHVLAVMEKDVPFWILKENTFQVATPKTFVRLSLWARLVPNGAIQFADSFSVYMDSLYTCHLYL